MTAASRARMQLKTLSSLLNLTIKGEVHSRMAIYFLDANKKFIQRYVIYQNFSLQRAL